MVVSNPKPPDGGWGWVIVICGFTNHVFTVGLIMSLSVFYVSWLDQFGESKGATSWILSIGAACMFGLCPIPASLGVRFGFRPVAFVGGLLTSFGLILSVFATSVAYLIISIGMISGIGCCFSFLPAMATVAMYFDHRRSLAMGLNAAGTGIGAFFLAPLLNLLEEMYGWRGAILILAGITLHMCVTGLLMRDLGTRKGSDDETSKSGLESDNNMVKEHREASEGYNVEGDHITADADETLLGHGHVACHDENNSKNHNVNNSENHNVNNSKNYNVNNSENHDVINSENHNVNNSKNCPEEHDFEFDGSLRNLRFHQLPDPGHDAHASHGDVRKDLLLVKKTDHSNCNSTPNLNARTFEGKLYPCQSFARSIQNMDLALLASMPSLLNEREMGGANVPRDSKTPLKENTTPDIWKRDSESTSMGKRTLFSTISSSKTFKANLELLSDKAHVAFCVSNFITNLSFITPVVFMVDRAVYQGIGKSAGAILVSANGIGSVAGRLFCGYMAFRFRSSHLCMYIAALTICGVGTMLSDLCGNIVLLHAVYAFFFGFLMGMYIVLAPIVTVDLTGVSVFATAYGQVLSFMGVATIFGPPLAGWLFDWTESYLLSYLTIGFFFVMSGVMLLPLLCKCNRKPSTMSHDE